MGILDDLRETASKKQVDLEDEEALRMSQENNYQVLILPKMQQLFLYFKELIDYLKVIEKPVEITDYSRRYPQLVDLYQKNFRLSSDKHGGLGHFDKLTEVYLRYTYLGEEENTFIKVIAHKVDADREKEFLANHRISFSVDQKRTAKSPFVFHIIKKIPVVFKFSVDYEKSLIVLQIQNHENFEKREQTIVPSKINNKYLDKLARYILKKDLDFLRMDMDHAAREKIRQKTHSEKQRLADELIVLRAKEKKELAKETKNTFRHKLQSLLQKKIIP